MIKKNIGWSKPQPYELSVYIFTQRGFATLLTV